jgi:hypothetical protein
MSKHFKKYALLLIAGLVICSVSCKKDSKDTDFVIEAKNVIDGNNDIAIVKASMWKSGEEEIIATGKYENNGFKLTLPATLDSKYLSTTIGYAPVGVNVSNPNAKVREADCFSAYDKNDNRIGVLFISVEETTNRRVKATYLYTDRNFSVTGSYTEVSGNTTEIATFDCSLKRGWNIMYSIEESGDGCSYFTLTTKKPSDVTLNWHYFDITFGKTPAANLRDKHFGKILNITK